MPREGDTVYPPFGMKIEPNSKIVFKGDIAKCITVERKIINNTKDRQCYKVRCNDNDMFRVRFPIGIIEPKSWAVVKLSYMAKGYPETGKQFFGFYHTRTTETLAEEGWRRGREEGACKQYCVFQLTGEKRVPPPKKEKEEKHEESENKETGAGAEKKESDKKDARKPETEKKDDRKSEQEQKEKEEKE